MVLSTKMFRPSSIMRGKFLPYFLLVLVHVCQVVVRGFSVVGRNKAFVRTTQHRDQTTASAAVTTTLFSTQQEQSTSTSASASSSSSYVPPFLQQAFTTECDNTNRPPSLNIILRSLQQLSSQGTDIRGIFVDHKRLGSIATVAHQMGKVMTPGSQPPLTPFAAHCFGHALASMLLDRRDARKRRQQLQSSGTTSSIGDNDNNDNSKITIVVGVDPRLHGMRLADAFCRGAESRDPQSIKVVYTGSATTPACAYFTKEYIDVDAAVMVTASHLPGDRNGLKLFMKNRDIVDLDSSHNTNNNACLLFSKENIQELGYRAQECATSLFQDSMLLPPTSGNEAVMCSEWVNWMPSYANFLKQAIRKEVGCDEDDTSSLPLQGIKIILNAGNGAGGFFNQVLQELGADVSASLHIDPDGTFPNRVPNPEYKPMLDETIKACQDAKADLGIMLDTDADRCGFVVPTPTSGNGGGGGYEALNRNRLIALLGVIFAKSSPNCTFVTCSVTSEGLTTFLQDTLGLRHVRYLKGYANVINKAKELDAEVGIETSGHCAMKENGYLDDGTYTAVKVIGLLAREKGKAATRTTEGHGGVSLLDLIRGMEELDEVTETRMAVKDESLDTMQQTFDFCALEIERACCGDDLLLNDNGNVISNSSANGDSNNELNWEIDYENLEGIRVKFGNHQFFMLRKSLHDPIISLQIEAQSKDIARERVIQPLLRLFQSEKQIEQTLDLSVLQKY